MHRQIVMVLSALSKFKGYTFSRRVTYTHTHRPDPCVLCHLLSGNFEPVLVAAQGVAVAWQARFPSAVPHQRLVCHLGCWRAVCLARRSKNSKVLLDAKCSRTTLHGATSFRPCRLGAAVYHTQCLTWPNSLGTVRKIQKIESAQIRGSSALSLFTDDYHTCTCSEIEVIVANLGAAHRRFVSSTANAAPGTTTTRGCLRACLMRELSARLLGCAANPC